MGKVEEKTYSDALEAAVKALLALQAAYKTYSDAHAKADLASDDVSEDEQARIDTIHGIEWVGGNILLKAQKPILTARDRR